MGLSNGGVEDVGPTARYRYIVTENDTVLVDPDDRAVARHQRVARRTLKPWQPSQFSRGLFYLKLQESQEQGGTKLSPLKGRVGSK
jgi:hypothetical protein